MAKKCLIEKQKRTPKFKVRAYNRCQRCGRRHAYLRKFGVCRLCFRELAVAGLIPASRRPRGKVKRKGITEMTMDPISDMLTTIRNGQKARLHSVTTPASNLKGEIARVMKESGYIADAVTTTEFPKKLVITLKYSDKAVPAITELKRVSKPGLRRYAPVSKIPSVLDGMGLVILSTSKGVMSGVQAKKEKLGGEVICTVA